MPIDIIVGLPHLREGPILQRARALRTTALISANGLSRWVAKRGWREWSGWRTEQLGNAGDLAGLCLDSAGFVAASRYGGFHGRWPTMSLLQRRTPSNGGQALTIASSTKSPPIAKK